MMTISMFLDGMMTLLLTGLGVDSNLAVDDTDPRCNYDTVSISSTYDFVKASWSNSVVTSGNNAQSFTCTTNNCTLPRTDQSVSITYTNTSAANGGYFYFGATDSTTIVDAPTDLSSNETLDYGVAFLSGGSLYTLGDPRITIPQGTCAQR